MAIVVFRCVWLLSFLSLFISQSCLANDQFNFNPSRLFSRKLCPKCDMRFVLRDSPAAAAQKSLSQFESQSHIYSKSDHAVGELIHPRRNNKYNKAWIVSAAAIMMLLVSTGWGFTRRGGQFTEKQENNEERRLLGPIKHSTGNGTLPGDQNQVGSQDLPWLVQCFCFRDIRNREEPEDFPSFSLDIIHKATKNFSVENKLGGSGFGCMYKGQLASGELIAVKRLTRSVASGQGTTEFTLISTLQHKNLIRLLGYCTEGNELLLVYEYMANGSLDDILFDSTKSILQEWKMRKNIINGIAHGLLHLHEGSGSEVIHCNLKPSKILLDDEMNPRISDFGLSRKFNDCEIANTSFTETIGYLAPEYVLEGKSSVKSDVFSFGILLLEIITVKKSSRMYCFEHGTRLQKYIWELWCEDKALELMDQALLQSCDRTELGRYIHIGLLCVQEDPNVRPTMSSIIRMLTSNGLLPEPTQPALLFRGPSSSFQSYIDDEDDSVDKVSPMRCPSSNEECTSFLYNSSWH